MESERKSRYELFLEDEARKAQPTKRCSKCGETKVLSEFHKMSSGKYGVHGRCKVCRCDFYRPWKNRIDRFWKMYRAKTKSAGGCIEWTGADNSKYPCVSWDGRSQRVARVVYQLSIGELLDGEVVTMTCHNYKCVRHTHLRKVSRGEFYGILNNRKPTGDRNRSRLHPETLARGDQHWARTQRAHFLEVKATLTEDDVRLIRDLYADGKWTYRALGQKFGVHKTTIGYVIRRETWAHVE